jgi:hypothetical protein
VKVRHDEGVVNRIGPEPCVSIREGTGEASAGVRQASHRAAKLGMSWVPTRSTTRKATRADASSRVSAWPGVVVEPGMCVRSSYGNWEISRLTSGLLPLARIGKARSRNR